MARSWTEEATQKSLPGRSGSLPSIGQTVSQDEAWFVAELLKQQMLVSWQVATPAVLRAQQDGPASRLGKEALRPRHSSAPRLRRHQVCCLRGRPRLRRPFLGGRPTRFDLLTRPVVVPRFAGGSTVHPALRRRSTASTSSMVFISFLFISYFHVCCELRSALLAMLRFFKSPSCR